VKPTRAVFLDCEFLVDEVTNHGTLSIGLCDTSDREFYAINSEAYWATATRNDFHREYTLPQMPMIHGDWLYPDVRDPAVMDIASIRAGVQTFFGYSDRSDTVMYANCGAQDLIRIHALWRHNWGDMPKSIPHWFFDLKALVYILGIDENTLPVQESGAHNALADAKHNRDVWKYIMERMGLIT
jgi:hypothetical protein